MSRVGIRGRPGAGRPGVPAPGPLNTVGARRFSAAIVIVALIILWINHQSERLGPIPQIAPATTILDTMAAINTPAAPTTPPANSQRTIDLNAYLSWHTTWVDALNRRAAIQNKLVANISEGTSAVASCAELANVELQLNQSNPPVSLASDVTVITSALSEFRSLACGSPNLSSLARVQGMAFPVRVMNNGEDNLVTSSRDLLRHLDPTNSESLPVEVHILVNSPDTCWTGFFVNASREGCGNTRVKLPTASFYSANAQLKEQYGTLTVSLDIRGVVVDRASTSAAYGVAQVSGRG